MGTQFIIMTDHFALLALYNNMGRTAPHRVDRHRGKLRAFDMLVEYIPVERIRAIMAQDTPISFLKTSQGNRGKRLV